MRAAVAGAVIVIVSFGLVASAANACTCAEESRPTLLRRTDVIFTGIVAARDDPPVPAPAVSSARRVPFSVVVDGAKKGHVDKHGQVVTAAGSVGCGYEMQIG